MTTNSIDILVVDDELSILSTMKAILEAKGYKVGTADNGIKAVSIAKQRHFDIAIIDIVMPEMNGVDTYLKLQKISPDTAIIMITGYGKEHPLVEKAIDEGIQQLLHKPVDLDYLMKIISSLINN